MAEATSKLIGTRTTDKIIRTASQSTIEATSQTDKKSVEVPKETSILPEIRPNKIEKDYVKIIYHNQYWIWKNEIFVRQ